MPVPSGRPRERGEPVRVVGTSARAVEYAAYDPELDRKVALKLVLPELEGRASATEGHARLLREAQALAKLSHPNVVSIHDVGTALGRVWIAMEFVEGQTLGEWARSRPPGWRDILAVMRRAGHGLAAAHAAGLLHRDFKPNNGRGIPKGPHGPRGAPDRRMMDGGRGRGRLTAARPGTRGPAPALEP